MVSHLWDLRETTGLEDWAMGEHDLPQVMEEGQNLLGTITDYIA